MLSIRNLQRLEKPFSVTDLIKISDGQPLSTNRERAGGWSYVKLVSDKSGTIEKNIFDKDFEAKVAESRSISSRARKKRLAVASKYPGKVRVVSTSFRRNPDVVVEVLARANGRCEGCKSPAPFIRAKDRTPYLEIHHKVTLADGGEDTTKNAVALCPNCHRRMHFGKMK